MTVLMRGEDQTHNFGSVGSAAFTGRILVLSINAPPVNALSRDVRRALIDAVQFADESADCDALIISCAGKTFFAGADIREFGKPAELPSLPDVVDRIESARIPVIAAIHGTALGGGLEVALGCHFRVAAASAKLGFPEVKLGLLPGAGGTQRLPRLIDIGSALEMMTSGNPMEAASALTAGLVDSVVPDTELLPGALKIADEAITGARPLRRTRDLDLKYQPAKEPRQLLQDFITKTERKFAHLDAPKAIFGAVRFGLDASFDDAIAQERSLFLSLQKGSQSQALRHVFFAEREAAKVPGLAAGTRQLPIDSVGVVGAGTMGTGIAINFLLAGIPVTLVETSEAALLRGHATIIKTIERNVASKRVSAAAGSQALARLSPSLAYDSLSTADLIIEAAFETMTIKQDIFGKLDAIAKPDAILATNTSYLDVDQIAAATSRPAQVLGMHFFSPANIMKLLEVVKAARTSDPVLATVLDVAKRINKVAVVAGVAHGFIGNRMLAVRRLVAEHLLLTGASPTSIDKVVESFGMKMGPFRMADLAGLDLGWNRETSKGATLRERLCELDRRGQKTGAGFYDYDQDGNAHPSPLVEQLIKDVALEQSLPQQNLGEEEIFRRLFFPMINEGAKILEEGKSFRASDIDVVWINGYGWPAWKGGPMFYADLIGVDIVESWLDSVSAELGERYAPCALLRMLAAEKSTFRAFDGKRATP